MCHWSKELNNILRRSGCFDKNIEACSAGTRWNKRFLCSREILKKSLILVKLKTRVWLRIEVWCCCRCCQRVPAQELRSWSWGQCRFASQSAWGGLFGRFLLGVGYIRHLWTSRALWFGFILLCNGVQRRGQNIPHLPACSVNLVLETYLQDGMQLLMDLPSDQSNSCLSCLSEKASGWAWSFCWALRRLNASTQLYLWPCCLRRRLTHKARWLIRARLAKCLSLTRNLLDWGSSWAVTLDVNTPAFVRRRGSRRGSMRFVALVSG